jgi:hypothetical protein
VELAAATATEPGVTRDWLVSCARVTLDHRVLGVSCMVQEITARKRAEARSASLARAGEILDSSLEYRQTLRRVARRASWPSPTSPTGARSACAVNAGRCIGSPSPISIRSGIGWPRL